MPEPRYTPTPKRIAAECRRIQATWSEHERRKRAGKQHTGVEVPRVRSAVAEPAGAAAE